MAWSFGLAERSRAVMKRHLDSAERTYNDFLEERQTTQRADLDVQARQAMPPFEELVLAQFIELMASTQYSLPQKAGIWQLAVPLLADFSKQRALVYEAYGRMMPYLQSQAQLEGRSTDLSAAFPQPNGYDQWYQQSVTPQPPLPTPRQPDQRQ